MKNSIGFLTRNITRANTNEVFQMKQKSMLRAEVCAHTMRANQNRKDNKEEVCREQEVKDFQSQLKWN
jgi:azurin